MLRSALLRVLVVVLAGAGLALTGPRPASAAFPGADGKLLVVLDGRVKLVDVSRGSVDLYAVSRGRDAATARWAPGGHRIVVGTTDGAVYVASPASTARTVVVREGASEPAWAPDGRRIVYVHRPSAGGSDLWVVAATGGTPTRLTSDGVRGCGNATPSWSPGGDAVSYVSWTVGPDGVCGGGDDEPTIVVLTLSTGARRAFAPRFGGGSWNPSTRVDFTADGSRVVFETVAGCVQYFAGFVVATATVEEIDEWDRCESGPEILSIAPSPSGGEAYVLTAPFGDDRIGMCVSNGSVRGCRSFHGLPPLLRPIEVQPR